MDRWKATALVLIGVVLGMVYGSTSALSATAAGSATGASRAVLYLWEPVGSKTPCPEGFAAVGHAWNYLPSVVCLED
jgi:hypothetical protein